jgi:hypothetical protein
VAEAQVDCDFRLHTGEGITIPMRNATSYFQLATDQAYATAIQFWGVSAQW